MNLVPATNRFKSLIVSALIQNLWSQQTSSPEGPNMLDAVIGCSHLFDAPNMIILCSRVEASAPATHLHRITTLGEVSHLFIPGRGVLIRKCGRPIKFLAGAGVYWSLNIKEGDMPHKLLLIEYWYLGLMIYLSLKNLTLMIWYDFVMTRCFCELL